MVAQDEAVTRILQLNKKFDTVMVYPAFGNEVSKAKALNLSKLLRLYHWLTSCFARKSNIMWFFANQMYANLVHKVVLLYSRTKKFQQIGIFKLKKVNGFAESLLLYLNVIFLIR